MRIKDISEWYTDNFKYVSYVFYSIWIDIYSYVYSDMSRNSTALRKHFKSIGILEIRTQDAEFLVFIQNIVTEFLLILGSIIDWIVSI